MRLNKFVVAGFVILGLFVSPSFLKADPIMQVSAEFVGTGNPVCGGSACTETIDLNFQLYVDTSHSGPLSPTFSNVQVSGSGVLGAVTVRLLGDIMESYPSIEAVMYFYDGIGDEIDAFYSISPSVNGYDFSLGEGFFYTCASAACITDFTTNGQSCINLSCRTPGFELESYSITQVPEPPTAFLTAAGLFLLLPMIASFRPGFRRTFLLQRHKTHDLRCN